jgi:hypothetical protein
VTVGSHVTGVSNHQEEKQPSVNQEIADEIRSLEQSVQQRKFGGKVSIDPSRTVILRQNVVRLFLVPHCEAEYSHITCRYMRHSVVDKRMQKTTAANSVPALSTAFPVIRNRILRSCPRLGWPESLEY